MWNHLKAKDALTLIEQIIHAIFISTEDNLYDCPFAIIESCQYLTENDIEWIENSLAELN